MSLLFSESSAIVAYSEGRVIGQGNKLPWDLPPDLKHFKETTLGNSVIMGYRTYQSIGSPLEDRLNIILSTKKRTLPKGTLQAHNLQEAGYLAELHNPQKEIIFIGGESLYSQILSFVNTLYVTEIHKKYKGNKVFPEINLNDFELTKRTQNNHKNIDFDFLTYKRTLDEEATTATEQEDQTKE